MEKSFQAFLNLLLVSLCLMLFTCHASLLAEDLSSASYKILQTQMTGGTANTTSTNYKVDEGSIDLFTKSTTSSTNYSLEGKFDIDGAYGIPFINSVTPDNYTRYFTDQSTSFTVSAVSPDAQALTYEAWQDGVKKDGPQSTNVLTWALSSADRGRRALKHKVIDTTGAVVKEQSMYVYRRPTK